MPQKVKVHSLTGRITLPLMHKAFRSVKRNRGAAEIDGTGYEFLGFFLSSRSRRPRDKSVLKLLSLEQFCTERDPQGKASYVLPRWGATSFGVAR